MDLQACMSETSKHGCMYVCMYAKHVCMYVEHVCMYVEHVCMYVNRQTYIHTYMHTYTYIHVWHRRLLKPQNPDILPGPKKCVQTLVSAIVLKHSGEPVRNLIF